MAENAPTLFDSAEPQADPTPFDPQAVGEHIAAHAPEDPYAEVSDRARRIVDARGEDLRAEQTGLPSDDTPVVGPSAARAMLRSKGPRREPTMEDRMVDARRTSLREGRP